MTDELTIAPEPYSIKKVCDSRPTPRGLPYMAGSASGSRGTPSVGARHDARQQAASTQQYTFGQIT